MSVPRVIFPLSPMMEIDVVPAWVALDGDVAPAASWWGVPVFMVRRWITDALRKGDYRTASAFSALLPRPAGLVKVAPLVVCTNPLTVGETLRKRQPELANVILLHRMQRSGQMFGRAFAPHCRRYRELPLV